MKTFVITTKNPKLEYVKIRENWFGLPNQTIEIESTIDIVQTPESDQSIYNNLVLKQDNEYRIILPAVVDPNLSSRQRSEYILDLCCVIAEEFSIERSDLYLIVHSRDLFALEDARSGYGIVFNKSLNCSPQMHERVDRFIENGHIFQFHHNSNDVTNLLLYRSLGDGESISVLGEKLYDIIVKMQN